MTFEQISSVLWMETGSPSPLPPYTAILPVKTRGILLLNHGHFGGNSCELRFLSQRICNLDILRVLKK